MTPVKPSWTSRLESRFTLAALMVAWGGVILWALWRPLPAYWHDYHHAFNEIWYAGMLRGEHSGYRLPPGYALVAAWFPGSEIVALRFTSLAAAFGLFAVIWWARGVRSALLVASLPWVMVWGSRAQTDMLMSTMIWIGLLAAERRHNFVGGLLIGLGAFIKPNALLGVTRLNWKFLAGVMLGAIPFAYWMIDGGYSNTAFHLEHGAPFGNWKMNLYGLMMGMGFAMALLPYAGFKAKHVAMAAGLMLLFAFWKAPGSHEYYLLPALIGLALLVRTDHPYYWWIIAGNAVLGLVMLITLSHPMGLRDWKKAELVPILGALWGLYLAAGLMKRYRDQRRDMSPPTV